MVFARSQKHPIRQEISLVNFNRPKKNVRIISRPPWFCEICQMALTFGPYKQIRAIVDGLGVMNLCQDGPKNGICAVMAPPNCTSSYPTSQIIYTITNLYHRNLMSAANWLHEGFCGQKLQSAFFFFFANSRGNFQQYVLISMVLYPMIKQTLAPPKCSLGGF